MKEKQIRRGDVYHANLNPVIGSEQGGFRPVLVIQNNIGNQYSPTVIVAAITSKSKNKMSTHVLLGDIDGLERGSVVLLEQLRTLDKRRLGNYIVTLDNQQMQKVNKGLQISIGLKKLDRPVIMCLCPECADSLYKVERLCIQKSEQNQSEKEVCMLCNKKWGKDYLINNKKH